jgi:hypothetical protein
MEARMPELLARDPAVVLEVLRSQGAQCGVGITPRDLTSCPQDRFCISQGGELCVYGARELGLMSELTREDVCGPIPEPKAAAMTGGSAAGIGLVMAAVLGFAFVKGRARQRG